MKCSITALKDLRDIMAKTSTEARHSAGNMSAEGESFEATYKVFERYAKEIRKTGEVIGSFRERIASLRKPFHREVRKALGEELHIQTEGISKKHYLLTARLEESAHSPLGFSAVLDMVAHDDLSSTKSFVFDMRDDTVKDLLGTPAGKIEGITPHLMRAVAVSRHKELTVDKARPEVNGEGDAELKNTLDKMVQGDEVLGSTGSRTSDSVLGYEKLDDFKHGDIDSMKSLMVKLSVLGGNKSSDNMMRYYDGLLDKMHPRFFNHLDMYLKRNKVESTGHVNITKDRIVLDINEEIGGSFDMTASEVYMHEVVHSMTAWALRQKARSVGAARLGLNRAMKVAKQHIKWQDFLDIDESVATSREVDKAKAKMAYIFTSKDSAEEFMAYTLTNPRMMELTRGIKFKDDKSVKEPTTIFRKVLKVFSDLLDNVLGALKFVDNDASVYDQVNTLAFALAEVNNRNTQNLKGMNPVGQMMEALEDSEGYIAEKLEELKNKVKADDTLRIPDEGASKYAIAKFYVQAIIKGMTSPTHRKFLGLWATSLHMSPTGTVREFAGGLFERDGFFRIAEKLKLRMDSLDALRNSVINANSKAIVEAFNVAPTEAEEVAITRVLLDTNLASLRYKRSGRRKTTNKEMAELLSDQEAVYKREGRLKHQINEHIRKSKHEGKKEWNKWFIAQAYSLGYFMATGKGHSGLNLNSANIVAGYGTNQRFEADKKLESLVGELAAVTTIKHLDKKQKALVARLLKVEGKALDVITDKFEGYKKLSKDTLFKATGAHMMEGHTKELFDDSVDIQVAPTADKDTMKAKGFTFRYEMPKHPGVAQRTPMAVYTTEAWGKAERLRGAVALGKNHSKGMTLSNLKRMEDSTLAEALFQKDFANVLMNSIDVHNSMKGGSFDPTKVTNGLVPIYSPTGKVTDFRHMMSRENKEKMLKQDLRVSQVISRSMAAVQYQYRTDKLNEETLIAIQEDMRNSWEEGEVGKDGATEYVLVGPDSTDPETSQLYAMMPESYKSFILSRSDKTMAIRADLLRILTGGAHFRTTDIIGLRALPGMVKSAVNTAEGVWMELVKISKGAILMKMPMILVWNIVSNVLFQVTQGAVDIPQLVKDYKESWSEVNEYVKYSRDLVRLQEEVTADKEALRRVKNTRVLVDTIGEKLTEINRIKRAMESNPSHKLFAAGLYQSHIEDLHNSALSESNRITKAVGSKLDRLPAPIKAAAEISYLSQNTEWYKASQEILQRSDMVSRLVEYKTKTRSTIKASNGDKRLPVWWLDKKKQEQKEEVKIGSKAASDYDSRQILEGKEREEFLRLSEDVVMSGLVDNYINYTLPNSNFEEYLNRLGVLMFTKYFKRIQSVILNTGASNPIKTAMLVTAASAGLNVEMIQDQAIIGKMFGNDGEISVTNLLPVYSPLYHLENVFMPALFKEEALGGLFQ